MMKTIDDIIAMEASVTPLVQKAKEELVNQIRTTPIPGVTKIGENCCTVSMSAIQNRPWSAEYYIADSQATIIESVVRGIRSATALKTKLTEMLDRGYVITSGTRHMLNDTTLGIIRKAIGEYQENFA